MATFWESVTQAGTDAVAGAIRGLPAMLDLPTEGQTPSWIGGPTAPVGTERTAPIYSTPVQTAPDSGGVPSWILIGGAVAVAVIFMVMRK